MMDSMANPTPEACSQAMSAAGLHSQTFGTMATAPTMAGEGNTNAEHPKSSDKQGQDHHHHDRADNRTEIEIDVITAYGDLE